MDETAIIKALGSAPGGVALAAVLVLVLYKVLSKASDRYIAALDRVAAGQGDLKDALKDALKEHTATDLEHHGEVREAVVRLETKVDSALDWRHRSDVFDRVEPEREVTPQSIPIRAPTASEASERRRRRVRTPPRGSGTD